jgi:nucleoside-diphosphate-sugar epimerase
MRVLVTGGSGFVGERLVRKLAEQGFAVRATYRRDDPASVGSVEWRPLRSLDNERCLAEIVSECDAVVHLAALAHQPGHPASRALEFRRVNTEGTRLLAQAAARGGVQKFIFVSSIAAVCTRSDAPVDDATPCAPTDAYGCSKLEAERALVAELQGSATDWCILRPPLIYGPGNPGNMRRLLRLMDTGLPLPFASIRNRRSFMFVDNLVDAMLCVLRHTGVVRCAYVVSDGSDFSTPDLVRTLAAAAGRRVRLLAMPVSMLTVLGRAADAVHVPIAIDRLVGSLCVDGSGFRRSFGWNPPVGVEQAFQQMGASAAGTRRPPSG